MDGGRNQRNLLARLVIVYSGAIGASEYHSLRYRYLTRYFSIPTNYLKIVQAISA